MFNVRYTHRKEKKNTKIIFNKIYRKSKNEIKLFCVNSNYNIQIIHLLSIKILKI